MEQYEAHLQLARLFHDNHWLSHAQQKCQEAIALGTAPDTEAADLHHDIERQLRDRSAFNLSRDHAPIAVLMDKECIISTLHFRHLENEVLKKEAFRQGVSYIDIETSSQCNRKCQYCPNSQNDRLTSNHFMEDAAFTSFVNDLHAINYSKELHFVGYNEPLLHMDDVLGRISFARKLVPRAKIVVFTNGDYLEREGLDHLIAAGSDKIIISVHLAPYQPYTDDSIFSRINKIAARLATPIIPLSYVKDTMICARLVHERVDITIQQTDYDHFGSNRAATLENVGQHVEARTAACLMPIYQFIVGHQGAVVPCCVMVSDDPRNAQYLMGNIGQTSSIFDTYCDASFVEWRKSVFNLAPKQGPCEKCNWDVAMPVLNAPAVYAPWQHLVSPPLTDPIVIR